MSSIDAPDRMADAILREMRAEADRIVAEEANAAQERVKARLREIAPRLAMSIMKHFDLTRDGQNIMIRVRADIPCDAK